MLLSPRSLVNPRRSRRLSFRKLLPVLPLTAMCLSALPAEAQAPSVVITEQDVATQELAFIGSVIDLNGSSIAVNQSNFTGINVTDFASATTIIGETSVLGVAQPIGAPTVDVPPGSRAGVLEDLFLNTNLQNPSVDSGIVFEFSDAAGAPTGLVNTPGADIVIFELSPPVGSPSPSGGPITLGGDPFALVDPATGNELQVFADGFDQFGGNGFSGSTSFFTAAGDPFTSLEDLETGELEFIITVPGLNLFGTTVDLSDLGIAEGESVTTLQLLSIGATGFGPDFSFIAGLPEGPTVPGIVDGALNLGAFGPFTSDFEIDVLTPQSGTPAFTSITAPLFTTITVDTTDVLIQSVSGDFLLDGSVDLSPQASLVGDHLTDIIGAGLSPEVFEALSGISDLATVDLESALLQLSPEPFSSAPVVLAAEQADLHIRQIQERWNSVRENGVEAGNWSLWSSVFGAIGNRDGSAALGTDGFDNDLFGAVLGIDFGVTDSLLVGVTGAYLGGDSDFDTLAAELEIDTGAFSVYALQQFGDLYAGASVGYGFGNTNSDRTIVSATGSDTLTGTFDTDHFFASAEVGWRTDYAGFTFEPALEFAFVNVDAGGFTETGPVGLALDVDNQSPVSALFIQPDLDVSKSYKLFGLALDHTATVGYRFEVIDDDGPTTASLVGAPEGFDLTVAGPGISGGAVSVGTAISLNITDNVALSLDYDGLYDNDFSLSELALTARWQF